MEIESDRQQRGTGSTESRQNGEVAGQEIVTLEELQQRDRTPGGKIQATNAEFLRMEKSLEDAESAHLERRTPESPARPRKPRTGRREDHSQDK